MFYFFPNMTNKLVRKWQNFPLWLFFSEALAYFLYCCRNCHWFPISFPFSISLFCSSLYLWSNKWNLGGFLCIPNIRKASKWLLHRVNISLTGKSVFRDYKNVVIVIFKNISDSKEAYLKKGGAVSLYSLYLLASLGHSENKSKLIF